MCTKAPSDADYALEKDEGRLGSGRLLRVVEDFVESETSGGEAGDEPVVERVESAKEFEAVHILVFERALKEDSVWRICAGFA